MECPPNRILPNVKKVAADHELSDENNNDISMVYSSYADGSSRSGQAAKGDANLAAIGSALDL
jgi:hypothetical protein